MSCFYSYNTEDYREVRKEDDLVSSVLGFS